MSNSLRKLLVVDIESSCWSSETDKPKNEVSEIIEIGLALVDVGSLTIDNVESIMVKPARSKISKFCTELTTITQEQVDKGITFKNACETLQTSYGSKKITWASWGAYDRKMFEAQCRDTYVDYPFSRDHINIKNVFGLAYALPKELNMPSALDYIGMQLKGTLHRGNDDAYNIANIFIHLCKKIRAK